MCRRGGKGEGEGEEVWRLWRERGGVGRISGKGGWIGGKRGDDSDDDDDDDAFLEVLAWCLPGFRFLYSARTRLPRTHPSFLSGGCLPLDSPLGLMSGVCALLLGGEGSRGGCLPL